MSPTALCCDYQLNFYGNYQTCPVPVFQSSLVLYTNIQEHFQAIKQAKGVFAAPPSRQWLSPQTPPGALRWAPSWILPLKVLRLGGYGATLPIRPVPWNRPCLQGADRGRGQGFLISTLTLTLTVSTRQAYIQNKHCLLVCFTSPCFTINIEQNQTLERMQTVILSMCTANVNYYCVLRDIACCRTISFHKMADV